MLVIDNRLLSRKTVSFSFSEPYDLIPSLLASMPISTSSISTNSPSLGDENSESIIWCALVNCLRTYFTKKSDFNEEETSL
jgi:hypothetical protein